jgi:hypothetical protein
MANSAMMIVSVALAFLRVGSRKAITPLLTASTPVIAVQPEENTFNISHQLNIAVAAGIAGSGVTGDGCPAACTTCHPPTKITIRSVAVNRYVGIMNTTPVSCTPRMFTMVRIASTIRQS